MTASAAGVLNAWLDANADGDRDDADEHFAVDVALSAGPNTLTFVVPATAVVTDSTFVRFRFSSESGLDYRGFAPDGEVEDYEVGIQEGFPADSILGRSASSGQWWLARSNGSSFDNVNWGSWSSTATWIDVVNGDFNGDGNDDIAGRTANNGDWWVARSNATGDAFFNALWGRWSTSSTWVDIHVSWFAEIAP